MKKFEWRLQRLLDLKMKQENALRGELVAITEKAVGLKGKIMIHKAALRQGLAELENKESEGSFLDRQIFFRFVHVTDAKIKALEQEMIETEKLRKAKIVEIMKMRKSRKGLEKLRSQAKAEFIQEQDKIEQKEMDDIVSLSYARDILMPV